MQRHTAASTLAASALQMMLHEPVDALLLLHADQVSWILNTLLSEPSLPLTPDTCIVARGVHTYAPTPPTPCYSLLPHQFSSAAAPMPLQRLCHRHSVRVPTCVS